MAERLEAVISLDGQQFLTSIKTISDSVQALTPAFDDFAAKTKSGIKEVGEATKTLTLKAFKDELASVAAELGGAFKGLVGPGVEFEGELRRINTVAKLSDSQLASFGGQIRNLNRELGTGVAPAAGASAAYEVMSAGFVKASDNSLVLRDAYKLASEKGTDASQATRVLTGALNAYGATAKDSAEYTDVLFKSVDVGQSRIPDLVQHLGQVTPVAAAAGVSFKELNAFIAALTISGVRTPEAIEGTRSALVALIRPGEQAQQELDRYGLVVNATTLKQKGLNATLQEIVTATHGSKEALGKIIPDINGLNAVLAGTKNGGAAFKDAFRQIQDSSGAAAANLEERGKSAQRSLEVFSAALEELKISFSEGVLPLLTPLIKFGTDLVHNFELIPTPIKTVALAATGLAFALTTVAAVGAGVLFFGTSLVGIFAKVAIPVGAVGTAATATGGALALMALKATAFLGIGALLIALAVSYTSALNKQLETQKEIANLQGGIKADGSHAFQGKGASLGALLENDPQALKDSGKANLSDYQQRVTELQDRQLGLANKKSGIEDIARKAGVAPSQNEEYAKTTADLDKVNESLKKLITNREKFIALGGAERADTSKNAEADKAAAELSQHQLDEQFKNEKAAIDKKRTLRQITDREAITALEQLQAKYLLLTPDTKRSLDQERTQLDRQDYDENFRSRVQGVQDNRKLTTGQKIEGLRGIAADPQYAKDVEKQRGLTHTIAEEEKKLADERFKQRRQDILDSTKTTDEKIGLLKNLQTEYKADAEYQKQIQHDIYETTVKSLKDSAEARKRQAAANLKQAQNEETELEYARSKGAQNANARELVLYREAKQKKAEIDAELDGKLAGEKDPDTRKKLTKAANDQKADVDQETKQSARALRDQDKVDQNQRYQDRLQSAQKISDVQIEIAKGELEAGKSSESKLAEAVKNRLALKEQEIKAQTDLVKLQNSADPLKIQQAELAGQAALLKARQDAKKELEDEIKLLDDKKKANEEANRLEFSGRTQTLEDVVKDLNGGSGGFDATAKLAADRFAGKLDGAGVTGNSLDGTGDGALQNASASIRTDDLTRQIRDARLAPGQFTKDLPSRNAQPGQSGYAGTAETKVKAEVVVRVVDDRTGKELPSETKSVTTSGYGSKVSSFANSFSAGPGLAGGL